MKKKIIIIIISIVCLGIALFTFTRVKADSGWDSSYDSGSDWGSSDWGSSDWGSSWDHDYGSSNYSSHSYSSSGGSLGSSLLCMLTLVIIFVIITILNRIPKRKITTEVPKSIYSDVSDELLAKYGINKDEFKQMIYKKYVDIQNAWMNFDYDTLKNNLTDELYNSYLMQLEVLKSKKQKNIMSDFEKVDAKIINITEENNLINVKTYLRVWMHDYVVDKDNKVVRGNKQYVIDIEYIIDWVREKDNNKEITCPHCGAEIKTITSGTCDYCRAKIVIPAKDYVMSRKMNVGQRRK